MAMGLPAGEWPFILELNALLIHMLIYLCVSQAVEAGAIPQDASEGASSGACDGIS